MSLIKKYLTEIISDRKYISLRDELGDWTYTNNDLKKYIWESDYISNVYEKGTFEFKFNYHERTERMYHDYPYQPSFIGNTKTFESLNEFTDNIKPNLKSTLGRQLNNNRLGMTELPIVYSYTDNSILFDHSIVYWIIKLNYIKHNENFKPAWKAGLKELTTKITMINIDKPYSLDSKGENPFPVEKDSEKIY